MTHSIAQWVDISPTQWQSRRPAVQPGDLSRFAPMGRGRIGTIPPELDGQAQRSNPDLFSLTAHQSNAFLEAPITEPTGGTFYLDGEPNLDDLAATLRLLGVTTDATDYAAFIGVARKPAEERYLTQLRIARRVALIALYDALTEEEVRAFPRQRLTVGELARKFIECEQQQWGTGLSAKLRSHLGRAGDRFNATLAFGIMVENAFYGVYRLWSRAWLL
jgi:hypothetical protein